MMRIPIQHAGKLLIGGVKLARFESHPAELEIRLRLCGLYFNRFLKLDPSFGPALQSLQGHAQSVVARCIRWMKPSIAIEGCSCFLIFRQGYLRSAQRVKSVGIVSPQVQRFLKSLERVGKQ